MLRKNLGDNNKKKFNYNSKIIITKGLIFIKFIINQNLKGLNINKFSIKIFIKNNIYNAWKEKANKKEI